MIKDILYLDAREIDGYHNYTAGIIEFQIDNFIITIYSHDKHYYGHTSEIFDDGSVGVVSEFSARPKTSYSLFLMILPLFCEENYNVN